LKNNSKNSSHDVTNTEITILKIGGSIITEKTKGVFEKANLKEMKRVSSEIAKKSQNLILVHGAGSFGHPYVEKYNLTIKKDVEGVVRTHLSCKKLNTLFCENLIHAGVYPFPIHPFSCFKMGKDLRIDIGVFTDALLEGIVPISHGDMVYNSETRFFEVLSGDRIVSELVNRLSELNYSIRVGMATDIDGVIFEDRILDEISNENVKTLLDSFEKRDDINSDIKSDVTGGMRGKILSLLEPAKKADIYIFNGRKKGNVLRFLNGKSIGTRIRFNSQERKTNE
jgi:isopentenyl phosphate kinase